MDSPAAFSPIPPHSTEAERSVLGAMLQSSAAVSSAAKAVQPRFSIRAAASVREKRLLKVLYLILSVSCPVYLHTIRRGRIRKVPSAL